MNRDILRQVSIILITIITLAVNGAATSLPLNNVTTQQLSDSYLVRFVPAGYVFAVWGIIYIGFLIFSFWQALPQNRENSRLRAIGWWYVIGSIANALWLVFWHYYMVEVTIVMMLTLLATLIYTVIVLNRQKAASVGEYICVDLPFHIYIGWISVATVVNVTVLLNKWGVTDDALGLWWAPILTFVAAGLAISQRWLRRDTAYGLVIAWALYGVGVKQAQYGASGMLPDAPALTVLTTNVSYSLLAILAVWWIVDMVQRRRIA
ncbi:MAG: tryptophan-rich sensory protein [Bacteroidota bacterium]